MESGDEDNLVINLRAVSLEVIGRGSDGRLYLTTRHFRAPKWMATDLKGEKSPIWCYGKRDGVGKKTKRNNGRGMFVFHEKVEVIAYRPLGEYGVQIDIKIPENENVVTINLLRLSDRRDWVLGSTSLGETKLAPKLNTAKKDSKAV